MTIHVPAPVPASQDTPLRVGDILHGYCGGLFDDIYECKRVEAIGADWVVARGEQSGGPQFSPYRPEELTQYRDDRGYCNCP